MSENTKEELEKMAKEKAEAAKKAAAEAADKLKNMSADEAKEMAKEKLESMKSLDNSAKLKYGGIALLVLFVVYFIFSGSSYNEEFLKDKLSIKNTTVSFDVESEEEIEFLGHKGTKLVLDVTYEPQEGKVLCQYDFLRKKKYMPDEMEKDSITALDTEEECVKLRYSNGKVTNQKVIPSLNKIITITFGKEDVARWEKRHSK